MLKGNLKNPKISQPHLTSIKKNPLASIASENRVRPDFSSMIEKWPSAFVSRDQVEQFTGGMIKSRYLANLDSVGKGPQGRVRCGRKVAYPTVKFVEWLEDRSTVKRGD